ncbi:Glutaredoxin [Apostasia shenzhenica]|uniref:Glutaredoxin n=1 Tax=Apostasia shenzhenica TaxID=1088818 RepID=A0A2I0AEL7_9ASPA|nr:Glutaredoxin [Apostasia shenzhenica]
MASAKAKEIASSTAVVVFSKTYCDACKEVVSLLVKLGASYKLIELDLESDGAEMQSALADWTGQRSVPNIFIGGNHIGGRSDVMAKHDEGKLMALLKDAGALPSSSPSV